MSELTVLQALRLKGRLTADVAATCTGLSADDVRARLEGLVAAGSARTAGPAFRITPEGRARLTELLDEERRGVDQAGLDHAYHGFDGVNTELKAVVTAWQLKDADTPNDHTDYEYDDAVIERLVKLHATFTPLLDRMLELAPRLGPYRERFGGAVDRIRDGDHTYVARPITDSYHTVWFEFHEELIGLLGRTRADEAAAGRAV